MKGKLSKLLVLLLSLVMAFAFTACGDTAGPGGDGGEGGNGGNGGNGGAGSVVIGALGDEEYINLTFTATGMSEKDESDKSTITGTFHLKKTDAGYDVVYETEEEGYTSYGEGSSLEPTPYTSKTRGWYLDGLTVQGETDTRNMQATQEEVWEYDSSYTGTMNDVLGIAGLTTDDVLAAVGRILSEGETTETGIAYSYDAKPVFNAVVGWIKTNQNTPLNTCLETLFDTDKAGIEAMIDELFKEGQTVSGFIAEAEEILGKAGLAVSFKEIVDGAQEMIGLTTAKLVALVNELIPSAQLEPPAEGKTIYDYLMDKVGATPVETVLGMFMSSPKPTPPAEGGTTADPGTPAGPTMSEQVAAMLKEVLYPAEGGEVPTVGYVIDAVLTNMDMGLTAEDIAMLQADALAYDVTVTLDDEKRPSSIEISADVDIIAVTSADATQTEPVAYLDIDFSAELTYGAPDGVEFAVPADIVVPPTDMRGIVPVDLADAKANGYTVEMYPGQKWDYAPKLYYISFVSDYDMSGTGVYYAEDRQNGSTEIKTGGTVLATIATADGKTTITLTKELFALYEEYMSTYGEAAVTVGYIYASDGAGYSEATEFDVL